VSAHRGLGATMPLLLRELASGINLLLEALEEGPAGLAGCLLGIMARVLRVRTKATA